MVKNVRTEFPESTRKSRFLDLAFRNWKGTLVVLLFISFILKISRHLFDHVISRDGIQYVHLIRLWHETGDFHTLIEKYPDLWFPPFPLFLMKSLMSSGLSAEGAGLLPNLVLGSLIPLILYGISWEVTHDRRLSLCSAILAVFHPSLNELSVQIQRDMIYLFFAGSAAWALCAGLIRRKGVFFCCAGILSGLSLLIRFESLEIPIIALGALLFYAIHKDITWGRFFIFFSIFLISLSFAFTATNLLMGTMDWIVGNYIRYSQWRLDDLSRFINAVFNVRGGTK